MKLPAAPLLALLLAGCAAPAPAFRDVLRAQLRRYPALEAQDLYKLCHQAAMGSAHLGVDTAMVHRYLDDELAGVAASAAEPLVEDLTPDGAMVRINLRPFKARGGDPDALFDAMMRSWAAHTPSPATLAACWAEAERLAAGGDLPFAPAALSSLGGEMAARQYPAVHHSGAYEAAYHPAYRVVLRRYAGGIVDGVDGVDGSEATR